MKTRRLKQKGGDASLYKSFINPAIQRTVFQTRPQQTRRNPYQKRTGLVIEEGGINMEPNMPVPSPVLSPTGTVGTLRTSYYNRRRRSNAIKTIQPNVRPQRASRTTLPPLSHTQPLTQKVATQLMNLNGQYTLKKPHSIRINGSQNPIIRPSLTRKRGNRHIIQSRLPRMSGQRYIELQ